MTEGPAQLLRARVVHVRHAPFRHRLDYRIWALLLDLDRLDEAAARSRLFRAGRPGIVSLQAIDHGPRDGAPLRPWVERLLDAAGLAPPARVRLLAMPRVLGYVFNPISLYLCDDAAGNASAVIYQRKNTFGDQHPYVAPLSGAGPHTHRADKAMHVSPFIGMAARYGFTLNVSADRFGLVIDESEDGRRVLTASMAGRLEPMTDRALAGALLSMPFVTLVAMAGIHTHALRLWLKGARYHPRPAPPDRSHSIAA
ncbi:MAG: DUF1365 domain-containing protein [Acetobacteraceae bacterium]